MPVPDIPRGIDIALDRAVAAGLSGVAFSHICPVLRITINSIDKRANQKIKKNLEKQK
ncbi:MAG: hypothetical protein IJS08_03865 [Victivallales bacterium]|nr:hypothetical protein [Victivallales bacterium]